MGTDKGDADTIGDKDHGRRSIETRPGNSGQDIAEFRSGVDRAMATETTCRDHFQPTQTLPLPPQEDESRPSELAKTLSLPSQRPRLQLSGTRLPRRTVQRHSRRARAEPSHESSRPCCQRRLVPRADFRSHSASISSSGKSPEGGWESSIERVNRNSTGWSRLN